MKAEISLEKESRHVSLLWALFAITEPFTHEKNELTLTSDDGFYSFIVRTDISYVAFGPRGDMQNPHFGRRTFPMARSKSFSVTFFGPDTMSYEPSTGFRNSTRSPEVA